LTVGKTYMGWNYATIWYIRYLWELWYYQAGGYPAFWHRVLLSTGLLQTKVELVFSVICIKMETFETRVRSGGRHRSWSRCWNRRCNRCCNRYWSWSKSWTSCLYTMSSFWSTYANSFHGRILSHIQSINPVNRFDQTPGIRERIHHVERGDDIIGGEDKQNGGRGMENVVSEGNLCLGRHVYSQANWQSVFRFADRQFSSSSVIQMPTLKTCRRGPRSGRPC
jgi:hypothetical protein